MAELLDTYTAIRDQLAEDIAAIFPAVQKVFFAPMEIECDEDAYAVVTLGENGIQIEPYAPGSNGMEIVRIEVTIGVVISRTDGEDRDLECADRAFALRSLINSNHPYGGVVELHSVTRCEWLLGEKSDDKDRFRVDVEFQRYISRSDV